MQGVEAIRSRFRPARITTLFVGESAPISGDFFYVEPNAMVRYMQLAMEAVFGKTDDFLQTFKRYGWYLDDLVLTPVNQLVGIERTAACRDAEASLASRISEYQPLAIVSVLKVIEKNVERAAKSVDCKVPRYVVPFPGFGNQAKFHKALTQILPSLPRA